MWLGILMRFGVTAGVDAGAERSGDEHRSVGMPSLQACLPRRPDRPGDDALPWLRTLRAPTVLDRLHDRYLTNLIDRREKPLTAFLNALLYLLGMPAMKPKRVWSIETFPGVDIGSYTDEQIGLAALIVSQLNRGPLLLLEEPAGE